MAELLQINKNEVESVRTNVVRSLETWLGQMQKMDRSVESLKNKNKGLAITALVDLYNEHAPKIKAELEGFITSYNETVKKVVDKLFEGDAELAGKV